MLLTTPHKSQRQRLCASFLGLFVFFHIRYSEKKRSPLSGGSISTFLNGRLVLEAPASMAN